jgi:hypothetical protein
LEDGFFWFFVVCAGGFGLPALLLSAVGYDEGMNDDD